ncbi:MAG: tape measure protein [Bacteroides sp.]|jgi:tape measure domain-containing protein|nr:tape measure protein [Bacteroides sp.]
MDNKLNFSIRLNLLIDGFKKSARSVRSSFASMQAQTLSYAAALGATTFSLAGFVSEVISVVRETSRANTTLKNVSASAMDFAQNLRFTTGIANKYGIYVNDVTNNFAKFSAAATSAGVSMLDQQKIFDTLSKSIVAYGMSSEDANLTFLAVTQMMSKGKISSEELRRQLGERLPIAMAAMAKAAGVPIQKLDKLLKQGKLMSADVLPKFADALNQMMPNVNTDNIETSINRLRNAFQKFANDTGTKDAYKKLIDEITKLVEYAGENIKSVISSVVAFLIGVSLGKFFKWFVTQLALARKQAMAMAAAVSKQAGVAFEEAAWKAKSSGAIISRAFVNIGRTIKAAFISMLPTAIFIAIGEFISYLKNAHDEAERVKNLFSDYKKESQGVTHTKEIAQLQVLQTLYNNAIGDKKLQIQYQNKIESLLGVQITKNQSINDVIRDRIKLLEATAKADFYTQKKIEADDKIDKIKNSLKLGNMKQGSFDYMMQAFSDYSSNKSAKKLQTGTNEYADYVRSSGVGFSKDYQDKLVELSQYWKISADASANIADAMKYVVKNENKTKTEVPDDEKKKKTALQKQEEAYAKQLSELSAKLEVGNITQAEYNKALGELNIKAYEDAKGTNDTETLKSKYFEARKKAAEEAVKNKTSNEAMVELEKIQKDFSEKINEYQQQYSKGIISQKTLNSSIYDLSLESAKAALGIKGIGTAADGFISAMMVNASLLKSPVTARLKKRDTRYDYKKDKADIAEENYSLAKDYVDELKTQLSGQIGDMMDELNNALEDADFDKALKIANAKVGLQDLSKAISDVKEKSDKLTLENYRRDIKDINKDLKETAYSGIKGIADSSDRVVSAWANVNEVMSNVDSSGWEKILAIWNAITNTVDGFLSVIDTVEKIIKLTKELTEAKQKESQIDTLTTENKKQNAIEGAATSVAASEIEKTAAKGEIAANTAKGASNAGVSASKLPFPANIIAIGAAISAALALFASIPKFATGGVKSRTGDNYLARINPGEMILNDGQQSRLFQMLDSGIGANKSTNINVGFGGVRGKYLLLAINNDLKASGKKPL